MKIFISGGCKNGKSYYAQHLAKLQSSLIAQTENNPADSLYYIATMKPYDGEDCERIERHKKDRAGWGFTTVEQFTDINHILAKCSCESSFLLDSLTALLANEMFASDGAGEYFVNQNAGKKISAELIQVLTAVENIVIVSDYIYSDAELYDSVTEKYRESLAEIDKTAAKYCDAVLEIAYANVIIHKGRDAFSTLTKEYINI
jgi:adenosylcobinamide kinase/adenosylcobinamide-phosphate guanylyltransferase